MIMPGFPLMKCPLWQVTSITSPFVVYSMRTSSFFFSILLICSYYNISLYMLLLLLLLYLVVLSCFGAHVLPPFSKAKIFTAKNIIVV